MVQSIYTRILTKTTLKATETYILEDCSDMFSSSSSTFRCYLFSKLSLVSYISFCLKHDAIYLKYGFLIYLKNQLKKAKTDRDFDTISDEHIIFLYIICKNVLCIAYDWAKFECSKSSHRRDAEVDVRIHCYKQIM